VKAKESVDIRAAVDLDATLRSQELEIAKFFGGASFVLGYNDGTSIRATNSTPSGSLVWTNFDAIVDNLVANRLNCLLTLGTDAPRWTEWKTAVGGTWGNEVNRPPSAAWSQQCTDFNAAIARLKSKYQAAGLDPLTYCAIQMAREPAKGGGNGPHNNTSSSSYDAPYSGLDNGTWETRSDLVVLSAVDPDRNLHAQLLYMTQNINRLGLPLLGPSVESHLGDGFTQELATIPNGEWLSSVDVWSLDHYKTIDNLQATNIRTAATAIYDSINYCADQVIASVTAWATKPIALVEYGGSCQQLQLLEAGLMLNYGHRRRGEILYHLRDKLRSCGRFQWLNFYVSRERTAATDVATFGIINSTGSYNYAAKPFADGYTANGTAYSPTGGYVAASGETSTM
jgi:hypothetical protein